MNKSDKVILSACLVVLVIAIGLFIFAHDITKQNKIGGIAPPGGTSNASSTNQSSSSGSSSDESQQPATPSCVSASQAASEEGQNGCVQFTGYAYTSSSGQMYLDQSTSAPYGFSAWIPAGSSFGPSLLSQYSGKNVDVTGSITDYNGEPEIEVTSASQIELAQ